MKVHPVIRLISSKVGLRSGHFGHFATKDVSIAFTLWMNKKHLKAKPRTDLDQK